MSVTNLGLDSSAGTDLLRDGIAMTACFASVHLLFLCVTTFAVNAMASGILCIGLLSLVDGSSVSIVCREPKAVILQTDTCSTIIVSVLAGFLHYPPSAKNGLSAWRLQ